MQEDFQAVLDHVGQHPGTTGYQVGLALAGRWNIFHTAEVLRTLAEQGQLLAEENKGERYFRYWIPGQDQTVKTYQARYFTHDLSFNITQPDEWFDDLEIAELHAEMTSDEEEAVIGVFDTHEEHDHESEWPSSIAVYVYGRRYGRDDEAISGQIVS